MVESLKNFETIKNANNSFYNWSDNSSVGCNNSNTSAVAEVNIYNNSNSIYSTNGKERAVFFFGFEDSWERDLWSFWLLEVGFKF